MRLTSNADCMASSAPNPYGQPQAAAAAASSETTSNVYNYADYNQITTPSDRLRQQQPPPPPSHHLQHHQRQQSLMSHSDGVDKPLLLHSSISLASYDAGYTGGMSSDSELTTSSAAARHHHRPYSSQSRVYHAHPVPRGAQQQQQQHHHHHQHQQPNQSQSQQSSTAARLSHYSNSAANVQSISSGASGAQSAYLPAAAFITSKESPVSPVLMPLPLPPQQQPLRHKQPAGGRQLPQRPFKQSMSIDHHQQQHQASMASQQQQQQYQAAGMGAHSPSRQLNYAASDPLATAQYQQQQQQQQQQQAQKFYPASMVAANQRYDPYGRLEMDLVEKQAANMALYDSAEVSLAELPPTGSSRSGSSSSSGRQLPNVGPIGPNMDPFHQQKILQQSSHDPYAGQPHQQPYDRSQMGGSADWLPSSSAMNNAGNVQQQQQIGARTGLQFKQTMSIDHYPASRQQQQHYSPARQAHFGPGTDQYQAALGGSYGGGGGGSGSGSPNQHPIGAYDSSLASAANQQQQQKQAAAGAYYAPNLAGGGHQRDQQLQHFSSQQQQQQQLDAATGHQIMLNNEHKHFERANTMGRTTTGHHQLAAAGGRARLQHQASSSSNSSNSNSNSNLSGSLKSGALDNNPMSAATSSFQQDNSKLSNSDQHQKSTSSASTLSHHYQQSPQHYKPPQPPTHPHPHQQQQQHHHHHVGASKQDNLRRGYTSMAVSSGATNYGAASVSAAELNGSQGALSESGDLSVSQASHSGQLNKRSVMRAPSPSLGYEASSSTGAHHSSHPLHQPHHQQHHHSTSSSQGGGRDTNAGMRSESSTGLPNGSGANSTLTKKSNSATQLSMTGTKKRLGFRKKQVTSFSVHRSEEVAPLEARHLVKQGSSVSEGDSSMSGDSSSRSWSNSNFKQQTSEELASMSFIDGLGKGQMISRQGLASPYLGDIQLSLCDRRGNLEIEVIRARNLQAKTNKIQPLTYVKLYLVKNRKCLGKAKTTLSNKRTLNPLFQQQLTFHEDYHGCILQSIVWGNFGKMDKKNFMGIAQISIDDLELSDTVISWYKLFLPSSLQTLPSKSLRHTLLSNSTESFTNTNNS